MELARIRLVGDVADRATHGACAKESTLRACQNFDALKINRIKVKVTSDERCRRVVDVQCDRRLRARGTGNLQTWRIR